MSLGNGTYHPASITYWDKSQELASLRVHGRVVTATIVSAAVVNFTQQSIDWAALVTASNALVNGLIRSSLWVNEVIVNANPAKSDINQLAKREVKLLIQSIDATTQARVTATLPTLNDALVTYLPQAKDFVAITEAQGAGEEVVNFVGAYQTYAVNPATGNALVIIGLKVVGRNN